MVFVNVPFLDTGVQFEDESFDAVIDKGGLDALMEPELGAKLGNQYLSEVSRILSFFLFSYLCEE